jgi:hypothetical protein
VARDEVPDERVHELTGQVAGPMPREMVFEVGHASAGQEGCQQQRGGARGEQVQHGQVWDVEVVQHSFSLKLNAPKNSDSPGWTKSRRRKNPDGLVQRRIFLFYPQNQYVIRGQFFSKWGALENKSGKFQRD